MSQEYNYNQGTLTDEGIDESNYLTDNDLSDCGYTEEEIKYYNWIQNN